MSCKKATFPKLNKGAGSVEKFGFKELSSMAYGYKKCS